jgi:hypothetical protein
VPDEPQLIEAETTVKKKQRKVPASLLVVAGATVAGGVFGTVVGSGGAMGILAGCSVGLVLGVGGLMAWLSSCNT